MVFLGMSGRRTEEETGRWRRCHSEELHSLIHKCSDVLEATWPRLDSLQGQ
jgi:hypothetical protein